MTPVGETPTGATRELDWSLLGWTGLNLLAARAAVARGRDPACLSPVAALTTLRDAIRRQAAPGPRCWFSLDKDDGYPRRHKTIRVWPRQKPHQPAGRPQLIPLNIEQRQTFKTWQSQVS